MLQEDVPGTVIRSVIAYLFLLAGCASGDCLPGPASDETPPNLRILVDYTPPGSTAETTIEITSPDSASAIVASRTHDVRVAIVAADSSGLRRLVPAITVQRTVGMGTEREYSAIDPNTSSCPVATLRTEYHAHTSGDRRVLIATALAENWLDLRTTIGPISIHME